VRHAHSGRHLDTSLSSGMSSGASERIEKRLPLSDDISNWGSKARFKITEHGNPVVSSDQAIRFRREVERCELVIQAPVEVIHSKGCRCRCALPANSSKQSPRVCDTDTDAMGPIPQTVYVRRRIIQVY